VPTTTICVKCDWYYPDTKECSIDKGAEDLSHMERCECFKEGG
jgi:hypothetical protein